MECFAGCLTAQAAGSLAHNFRPSKPAILCQVTQELSQPWLPSPVLRAKAGAAFRRYRLLGPRVEAEVCRDLVQGFPTIAMLDSCRLKAVLLFKTHLLLTPEEKISMLHPKDDVQSSAGQTDKANHQASWPRS